MAGGHEGVLPPVVLTPANWGSNWFEASWNPSENATDYYLTVIEKTKKGEKETIANDMGSGSSLTLPEGWTASATKTYTTAGNYGAAAPSYKMSLDGCSISSPRFDSDVERISFWYKGINCDGALEVTGVDTDGNVMDITSIKPEDQKGHTEVIGEVPAGIVQVVFTFKKWTGNIALDDIEIGVSGYATHLLDGYDRRSTNGETSVRVAHSGSDDAEYSYYVEATDGEFISRRSAVMEVPKGVNAVETVEASETIFDLDGKTLRFDAEAEVYDLSGRLLYRGADCYTVGDAGVYVVRQNGNVVKVIIR